MTSPAAVVTVALACLLLGPTRARAQEGEGDIEHPPARQLIPYNDFDLGFTSIHLGGGLLFDGASFNQDDPSEQQMGLEADNRLRDARFLFGGRLKTSRLFIWQTGIMWDKPTGDWFIRQTGLTVGLPEIWSRVFIGRGKEGFGLSLATPGYDGLMMERAPYIAGAVPLL